ncbi:PIN-like domain-containing protein [Kushneria sp. Sum13]|uniref:PIN-like domain-containing protein n=1 Tax=Kushneria sp. Sum13 TaxID=3459196 RepID=UPI00404661C4
MHIFIDENLGQGLARALHHLQTLLPENHTVEHVIDKFGRRGIPDEEWLSELQREGNWVILSKDKFDKNDPEIHAFREAGLTVFHLDKQWSKHRGWEEAMRLLKWWPDISKLVNSATQPMWYEVPWAHTPKLKGRPLGK